MIDPPTPSEQVMLVAGLSAGSHGDGLVHLPGKVAWRGMNDAGLRPFQRDEIGGPRQRAYFGEAFHRWS